MTKKSKLGKAQERMADAAKAAGAGAKDVASDALGAAAAAAAGVVLQRVSQTIAGGREKVERAVPADQLAMAESVGRSQRRRTAVKSGSGLRKAALRRKKSRATAAGMTAKRKKRAAANKKTLKKVASRKGMRRRSSK
jgi:hypothetical protein